MPWYLHLSDACLQRTLEAISSKTCDDAAQLSGAILLITSVPVACTVNQSFEWKLLSTDVCWSEYQFWWSLKLHAKTIINVLLRAYLHWLVLPTRWRMTPTEWDSRSHSWSVKIMWAQNSHKNWFVLLSTVFSFSVYFSFIRAGSNPIFCQNVPQPYEIRKDPSAEHALFSLPMYRVAINLVWGKSVVTFDNKEESAIFNFIFDYFQNKFDCNLAFFIIYYF